MPEKKKSSTPAKLIGKKDMKKVRGGAKHLAGVKYEDITLTSGTGTPPPASP